jgi:hypothetical protein
MLTGTSIKHGDASGTLDGASPNRIVGNVGCHPLSIRGVLAKAPPSAVERKLDPQGCARPRGALDSEGTAERLDAVFQPDEPGAPDRICSADPVVTDAEAEGTLDRLQLNIYERSLGVLGCIGERL